MFNIEEYNKAYKQALTAGGKSVAYVGNQPGETYAVDAEVSYVLGTLDWDLVKMVHKMLTDERVKIELNSRKKLLVQFIQESLYAPYLLKVSAGNKTLYVDTVPQKWNYYFKRLDFALVHPSLVKNYGGMKYGCLLSKRVL